jgi:hypothetical protein
MLWQQTAKEKARLISQRLRMQEQHRIGRKEQKHTYARQTTAKNEQDTADAPATTEEAQPEAPHRLMALLTV